MITASQQAWLQTLKDDNHVAIFPFNPDSLRRFKKLKKQIEKFFNHAVEVLLQGAVSLGISGQGELDVYLPVPEKEMDKYVAILTEHFGEPRAIYAGERIRFVTFVDGQKAEVFVINKDSGNWRDSCAFHAYLKKHPDALDEYRKLKEDGAGLSTRGYYTRKVEFINSILRKIRS